MDRGTRISLLRTAIAVMACLSLSGCLFSSPARPPVKAWTVEPLQDAGGSPQPVSLDELAPRSFRITRMGAITVLPPYDTAPIRVKRADGSLAEDAYNVFAAHPAQLLRRPVMSALSREQRFGHVVPPVSTASADAVAEVTVSELALDCRNGRKALVRLAVNIVKGRQVILSAEASSDADAASGDYTEAFSRAFDNALRESLMNLK